MVAAVALSQEAFPNYYLELGTEKGAFVLVTTDRIGNQIDRIQVYPAAVVPATSLPIGLKNMDCPFQRQQKWDAEGAQGENLKAKLGTFALGPLGLMPQDKAFFTASSNYLQGKRFYFEEGIVLLLPGFTDVALGHHDDAHPNIRVSIVKTDEDAHFRVKQWDGAAQETFNFTAGGTIWSLPFSVDRPEPIYYRLVRTWDGTTGTISVYVSHSGGAGDLEATSFDYEPSGGGFVASFCDHHDGDRHASIVWWRASGSDLVSDPSGWSTWTDPIVFESFVATPSGDDSVTWLDSELAGAYWNAPMFYDVVGVEGATLEARFAATDTVPAGNLSSFFAGAWSEIRSGVPIEFDAPGLQGRYLLIQLRHTPSTVVPLGAGPCVIRSNLAGEVGQAVWRHTPWPSVLPAIQINLQGERASEAVLPIMPSFPVNWDEAFLAGGMDTESPHRISFAMQTDGRRPPFPVTWPALTLEERKTLRDFFHARRWAEGVFTVRLPDGSTMDVHLVADTYADRVLGPRVWAAEAEFEQVGVMA